MRMHFGIIVVVMFAGSGACGGSPNTDAGVDADSVLSAAHPAEAAAGDHGPADTTSPTTLLAIMQQLGTTMMSLTHGLMTDSAQLVAASAAAIAEHRPIAEQDLQRIRGELGNDMADFVRLDTEVHEASVQLSEAAASGNTEEILARLNAVQRGCIACHSRFRERLKTTAAAQP